MIVKLMSIKSLVNKSVSKITDLELISVVFLCITRGVIQWGVFENSIKPCISNIDTVSITSSLKLTLLDAWLISGKMSWAWAWKPI